MGMFDTVNCCPNHEIQVKAWDRAMCVYRVGDTVPELYGLHNYSIVSPRGTYIMIIECTLMGCDTRRPCGLPIFDKWGKRN